MFLRILPVAVVAAVFGIGSVQAQSAGQLGGPSNMPPASFKGQQWVDSRGCVFLKAGYGGQITWVPRVGRNRKALCGFPPTGLTRGAIEVATAEDMAKPTASVVQEAPAIKPAATKLASVAPGIPLAPMVKPQAALPVAQVPSKAYAPTPTVATRKAAPEVAAAPKAGYEVVAAVGPSGGQIGCYTSAPVAERVRTRNGGTAVVCTRGDGTLTGWRPPIFPRDAGVGASLTDPGVVAGGSPENDAIPTPPKGYEMAWDDDRLNPKRGKGTAAGWAQQDQIWTRDVPSKLVADEPVTKRKKKVVYVRTGSPVTVSTKGQAATVPVKKAVSKTAKAGTYIQIGTFGVVSNAEGAAARLKGLGLPVARAKITSGSQPMQVVMAGPFGSASDTQAALSMARQAGFGDAFIR